MPGDGQARGPHRRAARRRRGGRRAALRRPRRHRLHRGRARPPREGPRAPRELAVRRRRRSPEAAARVGLRRADAGRRGRVHRVDERRRHAPPVLQGPARGGAAVGVPRRRHAGRATAIEVRVARSHAQAHEPRQGPLSRGRLHQARRHRVLRARRAGDPAAPRGPPADAQALPQRRRRQVLLREATRRATGPTGSKVAPIELSKKVVEFTPSATTCRRSSGSATSPRSSCTRRCSRAVPIERPTMMVFDLDPGPAGDDRRVLPRRADRCRGCSRTSACRRSRRRRAPRACRSTSR